MYTLQKLCARTQSAGQCRPVVIAFLGDSVTHGCFEVYMDHKDEIGVVYAPDDGYPYLLKRRLEELYPAGAVNILNAGVSGEGAREGANRIERDVLDFHPDLVVIAFALNDSMNDDVEGGLRIYREAMDAMIRKVLATGAECILLTPNFMCTYVSSLIREEPLRAIAAKAAQVQNTKVLLRYVQAARAVASNLGIPVADAYNIWEQMAENGVDTTGLLSNHINHPTQNTHYVFVDALLRVMLAANGTTRE